MTEAEKRLLAVNERLKVAGVRGISFTWAPDANKKSNDELCIAIASALENFLDGKTRPLTMETVDHDS